MIDVHCHLNFKAFNKDAKEAVERAQKAGVEQIINTGTSIESSQEAVKLSEIYEDLFAIVGIHPHHADKLEDNWSDTLDKLAKKPKVVGIGEIGMDFYSYKSNGIVNPKIQREVFETQIQIAYDNKLPLQIHGRHAGGEILEVISANKNKLMDIPGMFHCFAGNIDYLKKVLEMGFYVGFDGNITYAGIAPGEDTSLSELIKYAPLERIVTETDAPFLTPEPHRGSRNEPSYVIIVASFIAKIKNSSFDEVNEITTQNARKIFKL